MNAKLTTYKGYTIETVGISRYIYRPGMFEKSPKDSFSGKYIYQAGYAQSIAEAKRWITSDMEKLAK